MTGAARAQELTTAIPAPQGAADAALPEADLVTWLSWLALDHVLVVLGVLAVALAMILALQDRRTPQGSVAWILFIIALPYVAVPIFLMLGFRKVEGRIRPLLITPPEAADVVRPEAAGLFTALGAPEAVGGNHMLLHEGPQDAARALSSLIAGARHSIDVALYVLAPDASGRSFVEALRQRAEAGVRVRVLLDGFGAFRRPRKELAALVAAGGELRLASPLQRLRDSRHVNLRNHRKLVLADGSGVWTGGRNVGDHYLHADAEAWCDLSMTLSGPVVRGMAELFASDWHLAGGPKPPPVRHDEIPAMGRAMLQLVPSGPDEPLDVIHDGLVSAIYRAERRIWLATPYFVPTDALMQALANAARRGVDLRLIVPERSNQWTTDIARGAYLRALEAAGGRVARFQPAMLHAKAVLIDDRLGLLGSANLDVRSMLLNFELAVAVHDTGHLGRIEAWFDRRLAQCTSGTPPAGRLRRLIEAIFRLGSPIL